MRKCTNCGSLIGEGQKCCEACGMPAPEEKWYEIIFWFIVSFIVPLAGIVYYIKFKEYAPKAAKAALIGSIAAIAMLLFWYIGIPLIGMMISIG